MIDNEIIKQRIDSIKSHLVLRECKVGIIYDIKNKYIEKKNGTVNKRKI